MQFPDRQSTVLPKCLSGVAYECRIATRHLLREKSSLQREIKGRGLLSVRSLHQRQKNNQISQALMKRAQRSYPFYARKRRYPETESASQTFMAW